MTNLTNILAKLTALIEKNKAYIIDGSLNRNLLAADARKYDPELLNLLQKDAELKEHFFATTDGGLVFKKDVFLQFIMNKEFLPDSYTKYKIKIGLGAEDGSLLSESGDVVLNWPYKDAILEGGQDKEDQKRSEVFFNEVLAPDQITRLLDDKVFTNWKRYDKDGEHDLDELKNDDNLIIKGNNLVVLRCLEKRYAGKVKLIYIDPPYNTGNDSFAYNDSFNHSTWLTFMKNRLEAAKRLLKPDGLIFIQCDKNEESYLGVLCDEIFGREKHISSIALMSATLNGIKTAHKERAIIKQKDSIHVYYNLTPPVFRPQYTKKTNWDKHYNHYLEFHEDGAITDNSLKQYLEDKKVIDDPKFVLDENALSNKQFYEFCQTHAKNIARLNGMKAGHAKDESLRRKGEVIRSGEKGDVLLLNGSMLNTLESSLVELDGKLEFAQLLGDMWTDISFDNVQNEGGNTLPGGKKPEKLLQRIINMCTNPGDIVLDYHLGSGTTAAVAHKMARQYIGVEQLYYGRNDPVARLVNVINGDKSGISKSTAWQGGGSFVYANIMNNSNKFRKRVESAKTDADYLQLLKEATSSSFLSYRVDPKKLNEDEFRKLSSAEKRRLLLELIDNNTLYVNYEDINDPIFKVSEKDKEFNKKFYEKN